MCLEPKALCRSVVLTCIGRLFRFTVGLYFIPSTPSIDRLSVCSVLHASLFRTAKSTTRSRTVPSMPQLLFPQPTTSNLQAPHTSLGHHRGEGPQIPLSPPPSLLKSLSRAGEGPWRGMLVWREEGKEGGEAVETEVRGGREDRPAAILPFIAPCASPWPSLHLLVRPFLACCCCSCCVTFEGLCPWGNVRGKEDSFRPSYFLSSSSSSS